MKAVALKAYLPITHPESLLDVELPEPSATGHDLLVDVSAISVNPVDTKVRAPKDKIETDYRVLGWDAVGTVIAVGELVTQFVPGDQVYYAGSIARPGSNSQRQRVDERIVGHKPKTLSNAEAAALPLTAITAWEGLFDRLQISTAQQQPDKTLLIIGGAGGVGSLAIQLAKQLAGVKVIATASRTESADWCLSLGADLVINHHQNLQEQLNSKGIQEVDYIFCLNNTDQHWKSMCALIKPQGKICSIVETKQPVDLQLLMGKSAGFIWELMFTRPMFTTEDIRHQSHLLNKFAELMDNQIIKTSLTKVLSPINACNLRKAHADIETGRTIGKIVIEGWE